MTTNQSRYEEMIIPVRCKDCKWSINNATGDESILVCNNLRGAGDAHGYVYEDDYCSYGEGRSK